MMRQKGIFLADRILGIRRSAPLGSARISEKNRNNRSAIKQRRSQIIPFFFQNNLNESVPIYSASTLAGEHCVVHAPMYRKIRATFL